MKNESEWMKEGLWKNIWMKSEWICEYVKEGELKRWVWCFYFVEGEIRS